jgi:hypothetical protein
VSPLCARSRVVDFDFVEVKIANSLGQGALLPYLSLPPTFACPARLREPVQGAAQPKPNVRKSLDTTQMCERVWTHLGKKRDGVPDESYRERMVKDHPSSANQYSRLEETMGGKRGEEARHVALNYNFPFAPIASGY